MGDIDFSKGGYGGDSFEEAFKYFTVQHLEYWWHFREVLRASDRIVDHWEDEHGNQLSIDAQRELIALSMTNHAVYLSTTEALVFFEEMRHMTGIGRLFDSRRFWKAAYSSLYTSFNAISNIVYSLIKSEVDPQGSNINTWQNLTPGKVISYLDKHNVEGRYEPLLQLLKQCQSRLDIRHHLDHFWTIWIMQDGKSGELLMDADFEKGKIITNPDEELKNKISIAIRLYSNIVQITEDYNEIYKIISLQDSYLDRFLVSRNWYVRYSDLGEPHNGQRPKP